MYKNVFGDILFINLELSSKVSHSSKSVRITFFNRIVLLISLAPDKMSVASAASLDMETSPSPNKTNSSSKIPKRTGSNSQTSVTSPKDPIDVNTSKIPRLSDSKNKKPPVAVVKDHSPTANVTSKLPRKQDDIADDSESEV